MDDQLRISDAERERAAAELAEPTPRRLTDPGALRAAGPVSAARTRSDLLPCSATCPVRPVRSGGRSPSQVDRTRPLVDRAAPVAGPRRVPGPLLVVLVVLLVISVATQPCRCSSPGSSVVAFVLSRHRRRAPCRDCPRAR